MTKLLSIRNCRHSDEPRSVVQIDEKYDPPAIARLTTQTASLIVELDEATYEDALRVTIHNGSDADVQVTIGDLYSHAEHQETIRAKSSVTKQFELTDYHNWYDLTVQVSGQPEFLRHLAGHLENGRESFTDPAMGNPG